MADIKLKIADIISRIKAACIKVLRDPEEVILLAATKDVPVELVEEAINAGITNIGENKVQEAEGKAAILEPKYPQVTWHMIGHLQTNKVARALEIFDIIGSVDSRKLADAINKESQRLGKTVRVFVEVNVSGETSKFGIPLASAEDLVKYVAGLPHLKVTGLMTVPPYSNDPEGRRPYFRALRELKDRIGDVNLKYLSMGMSDDFTVAVEEGSNIVRIGRGIFGIEHKGKKE
jgi:pyridoxal phosphate enzyme (YggS family)